MRHPFSFGQLSRENNQALDKIIIPLRILPYFMCEENCIILLIFLLLCDILILLSIFHTKGNKKMKVTKDSLIGDILDHDVNTAKFFFEIGMHCLGCPHSRGESIAEACAVHGTDADELVAKINEYLENK